jgi:hypothetical protein
VSQILAVVTVIWWLWKREMAIVKPQSADRFSSGRARTEIDDLFHRKRFFLSQSRRSTERVMAED